MCKTLESTDCTLTMTSSGLNVFCLNQSHTVLETLMQNVEKKFSVYGLLIFLQRNCLICRIRTACSKKQDLVILIHLEMSWNQHW